MPEPAQNTREELVIENGNYGNDDRHADQHVNDAVHNRHFIAKPSSSAITLPQADKNRCGHQGSGYQAKNSHDHPPAKQKLAGTRWHRAIILRAVAALPPPIAGSNVYAMKTSRPELSAPDPVMACLHSEFESKILDTGLPFFNKEVAACPRFTISEADFLEHLSVGGFALIQQSRCRQRVKILREVVWPDAQDARVFRRSKENKWEIKPVGGDELDALAKEVAKPSTEVIERLKLLLGD
jgi:hypothetical protein